MNKNGSFTYSLPKPLTGGTVVYVARHNKATGEVVEVKKITVKTKKPAKPKVITRKVDASTEKISVLAGEKATVIVKVGKKTIKQTVCKYSRKKKGYVYSIKIPKGKDKLVCCVRNAAGNSKKVTVKKG